MIMGIYLDRMYFDIIESEENSAEEDDGQEASPETPADGEEETPDDGEKEITAEGEKEKAENETIGSEDKEANAVQDQGDANEVEKELSLIHI